LKFAKPFEYITVLAKIPFNMPSNFLYQSFFYVEGLCFLGCAAISLSEYEGTMIT